jgi:uncharacterized RDD family membrane protein YckC
MFVVLVLAFLSPPVEERQVKPPPALPLAWAWLYPFFVCGSCLFVGCVLLIVVFAVAVM